MSQEKEQEQEQEQEQDFEATVKKDLYTLLEEICSNIYEVEKAKDLEREGAGLDSE